MELYEGKIPAEKEKELILVPTTCGTGSEVTNISILELTTIHTKKGLAQEALFADEAVLIPELLKELPFRFFATSSIDAFIHSVESYLSPKASAFSKMYSRQAMKLILEAYQIIAKDGEEAIKPLLGDLLLASTYAGIAFGNAGCAAVHAMSYPLGAARHVPHGEANYAMFAGVFETYMSIDPNGAIKELNEYLAEIILVSGNQIQIFFYSKSCHKSKACLVIIQIQTKILPENPESVVDSVAMAEHPGSNCLDTAIFQ